MKYIKYILTVSMLMYSISTISQIYYTGDYEDATTTTPNGTSVNVGKFIGSDFSPKQKNDLKDYWMNKYLNIKFEGEATKKYNCHAWAWAESTEFWMNQNTGLFSPQLSKYWDDYSYVEVSNPTVEEKVFFGGPCWGYDDEGNLIDYCDHSAIKISNSNYFISKWGMQPRFMHLINDCPYTTTDLHYYVKRTISGPSVACQDVFTLNYPPPGTIYWTVNGLFDISPTTGTSTTLTANAGFSSANNTTLYARIGGVNGAVVSSKEITLCPPVMLGSSTICTVETFSINTGHCVTWFVPGGFSYTTYDTGRSVKITANPANGQQGTLQALLPGGVLLSKNIKACVYTPPPPSPIQGPDVICTTGTTTYTHTKGDVTFWSVSSNLFTIVSSDDSQAKISTSAPSGTPCVIIAVSASSGGSTKSVTAGSCKGGSSSNDDEYESLSDTYISVYPNPVSGILTIEINVATAQNLLPVKANLTFDVRLHDNQGNLLRQQQTKGGIVEFNVANLSDGIYYLHIYDGVSETPEMRQIMVEH